MSGKINELISQVAKDFKQDKFDKFIHEINFPKFKGFAPGTKIKIYFPICVIVGPNGGGKSSVLQAAWGMPQDHSTSRFWFSTPVDPIDNKSGNQNRYWYSHYVKALDQQVQCRKISGNKRNGYWEPSRPNLGEGMARIPPKDAQNTIYMRSTGDRWNQVVRTPHYINAKAESSAFDRFFYFSDLASLDRKQNHFVKYSRRLKQVIELDLKHSRYYGLERVFSNFLIPSEQLKSINDILQKKYRSARYVMHAFYDKNRSPSVILKQEI